MKNIKMIVSDLDGTLLTSKKTLSTKNRSTINKAKKLNIKFVIASGRPLGSILLNLKTWGIDGLPDYIIHTNGFGYYETITKKDHASYKMKEAWCNEIIHLYYNHELCLMDYDGYKIVTDGNNPTILRVQSYNNLTPTFTNLDYFTSQTFPKLVFTGTKENIDNLERKYKNIHKNLNYHGFRSATDIFEFVDARVSKSFAIKKICNQLNIDIKDVIAFGDSDNDYEMLKDLNHSVAMGNADKNIKTVATYTTLTNDEDGFAYFINKNILGGSYENN